jgi:folate-binding protein YgfZ
MNSGYQALRESAAWFDVSAHGRIKVSGEDRARLLHAMTTNHVQALQPGHGLYAFFLNAQGRILADSVILAFDNHMLLDVEPEAAEKLYEHIDKYIIADDVTLENVTETLSAIAIEGPASADCLAKLGAPVPAELYSHQQWDDGFVARVSATGGPGYRIYLPAGSKSALIEKLEIPQATPDEARTVRIEHGTPRYGEEMTERYLSQEVRQMHAMHFSKGCYLGQEIVERVRSRGQVHRHLLPLDLQTNTAPEPGAKLTHDGKDAAEIASAVYSPALGHTVALAFVRTDFAKAGAEMEWNGAKATVRAGLD